MSAQTLTLEAIDIHEIGIGRQTKKAFNETISILPKMASKQLQELKEAIKTRDSRND